MLDPEDNLGEFPTLESQNIVDTNHANTYLSENNNDDEDEIFNGITQLEINSPSCNGGSVYNEWSSSFGDDRDGGVSQSIAERRAATRGFNAGSFSVQTIKVARFRSGSPLSSPATRSPFITIPAGISPAELLDSPVMLPYSQAQASPTTGTFQISPLHRGSFMLDSVTPATDREREYDVSLSSRSPHLENHISFPSATSLGSKGYELPDEFARSTVKNSETELSVDFEESRVGINHLASQSHPEGDQQADPLPPTGPSKASEDGYNWRKYGQKQVKGSELPRSYYRCTYPECKMSKKVERFHDGEVAEIIYIGNHNHPQPHPNPRSSVGNSFPDNGEMNEPLGDDGRGQNESSDPFPTSHELDCHDDNKTPLDGTSIEDYGYLDESEPKRRKIEAPFPETRVNSRGREPKVVVQIESEVDILEDGYRWRKYGQKVVKGNPNPRSYYKCTSPGCKVRKHVERARDDYKFVITTYEGKHDHEVPAAKTTGVSGNNSSASTTSTQPAHALSRFNTNAPRLDPQLPRIPDLGNEFMRSALLENLGNDMYPLQFPRLPNPMSYGYGGMPNFQVPLLYGVPRPLFTMQDGMDLYNLPVAPNSIDEQQTDENDVALIEPKQENI